MSSIYLDNAATTPVDPRVREAMLPFLGGLEGEFGNPSSRHPLGVRASEAIDGARRQVARALGADPQHVTFTSGGTEANNLAVFGLARAARSAGRHILIGATEHASVRASAVALRDEGFEVEFLTLDQDGALDEAHLSEHLRADTVLVSQMLVNNEFGTVYPVARVARLVRARAPHARLHADCVQGLGKLDCSPAELGVDCVTISSHKVHGPKGAGAVVLAGPCALRPLLFGGGQERELRPGTQNVPCIVGFGLAAELAEQGRDEAVQSMAACRAALVGQLEAIPGVELFEPGSECIPSLVAVRVPWAPAEVVMHHLEASGVYVSSGSACQAGQTQASAGAQALGLDAEGARHVLRWSFSSSTTLAEVTRGAEALAEVGARLGSTSEARAR